MKLDDAIHGMSTLIVVGTTNGVSQGTRFFYQKLDKSDPEKKGGQWRVVERVRICFFVPTASYPANVNDFCSLGDTEHDFLEGAVSVTPICPRSPWLRL